MPWQSVQLGEVATFRNGLNFSAADRGPGVAVVGIPDFYLASFVDYRGLDEVRSSVVPSDDALLKVGDILFVRSNGNRELIGRSLLVRERPPKPTSHSGFTIRLRFVDLRADPLFFAYLLRSDVYRQRMSSQGGGTSINNLNQGILSRLEVPLPPLETQRRIAAILGAYDDLIEVNRRRVAVLEETARGLFEEWFVRFRFPGHEAVPIIDTPDGPLPEGWEWRPFSSIADFMNGFAFKPSHFEANGLPIIKIPELKSGVSAKTPRNSGADVPARYWVDTGDLLFSWSGTFAVSEWTGGKGLLNQHLFLVRPEQNVERGLLKAALRWAMPLFDNQGVGATMKHIRRSALDHTKVPYPTDQALLQKANAVFGSTYSMCTNIRCQNDRLAASRDLLLPRLISGQLSVETAERELEAAA